MAFVFLLGNGKNTEDDVIPVVVNVRKLCRIQNTGVRFVRKSRGSTVVRGEHQVEK